MLSRSYRQAAGDERKAARRAAVTGHVTGDQGIDDAALSWLTETTLVLALTALALLGIAGYEAAQQSARSVPLFIVGAIDLAIAIRSAVRLARLRRRQAVPVQGTVRS
jgi:hypothetical protein